MSEGFKARIETAIKNAGTEVVDPNDQKDVTIVENMVTPEAWATVESIQQEKRQLVEAFREWRKKFWRADGEHADERAETLDTITHFEMGEHARTLRATEHGFEAIQKGGEVLTLTKGEVFAATLWGVWWKFDASVQNETQIQIMSHQVHKIIAEKYDTQLVAIGKTDRLSDDRKRDTYVRIGETQKNLEIMPDGIIAEKMLMSFLTKEMYDGKLPFEVTEVDIYEDLEHKIDFIITVADRVRGVGVAEPEHRFGIQFTLDPTATARKEGQLARARKQFEQGDIDELILVTMPIDDIRSLFTKWRYNEQGERIGEKRLDPRGPDYFWSDETKKAIIAGLLKGVHLENQKDAA